MWNGLVLFVFWQPQFSCGLLVRISFLFDLVGWEGFPCSIFPRLAFSCEFHWLFLSFTPAWLSFMKGFCCVSIICTVLSFLRSFLTQVCMARQETAPIRSDDFLTRLFRRKKMMKATFYPFVLSLSTVLVNVKATRWGGVGRKYCRHPPPHGKKARTLFYTCSSSEEETPNDASKKLWQWREGICSMETS